MPVPTTIESLSTTAASNGPSGSDQRTLADDGLRQAYAFTKMTVSQGADIASATTITPPSTGVQFDITGTTSITTIASTNSWDGRIIYLQFDGALTLTHSSNLYLPGAANITTVAGDVAMFIQRGSGSWQCINYLRKDGSGVGPGLFTTLTATGNTTLGNAGTDTVTTNGNVTHNAPSSGYTTTIIGATGSGASGAQIVSTAGAGNYAQLNLLATGAADWRIRAFNTDGLLYFRNETAGANYFAMTNDGRLYGTALHNNSGAVTGTTNQYIASGTYTPTGTATTNIDSVSSLAGMWTRVGNVVSVSITASVDTTAGASTATTLGLSLPIASNFTAASDCVGTCTTGGTGFSGAGASVFADTTNDRISVQWLANTTGATTIYVTAQYVVL